MISLFRPSITRQEIDSVVKVLRSGWIGLGPKTSEFEKKFASFIGSKYAVGLNSATSALDLALKLINVSRGDEVIVPTMTFVSTAHAVVYNSAKPIFTDVNERTLNIDFEDVKRKITSKTKAIIPVHYGGRSVDIDKLRKVVGKDIYIIEDAAHACGAEYKKRKCGALGDIACFSFHAVKNLTTADGGALTTNRKDFYIRAKKLRWLGIDKGTWDRTKLDRSYWWEYNVEEVGLKCHMNDIQAALGLVQLRRLKAMNQKRKKIVQRYNKGLKNLKQVILPPKDDKNYKSSWHLYWIKCENRDDLSSYLKDRDINTGVHYKPIHTYKCYGKKLFLPKAEKVFPKLLSLPIHPGLKFKEVDCVIKKIWEFYDKRKRN